MLRHILANVDLSPNKKTPSLKEIAKERHLSHLSFFLGGMNDKAVLEQAPDPDYLNHLQTLNAPIASWTLIKDLEPGSLVDPWKLTKHLTEWTLAYPYHPLIQIVDSKAHTFSLYKPPFAEKLIKTKQEVIEALRNKKGSYVLKLPESQSGLGHFFINAEEAENLLPAIDYQNVRLEKWVDRVWDFSSQWLLDKDVTLLGVCELLSSPKGKYQSSIYPVQNTSYDAFITAHLAFAKPHLEALYTQGLRGHVGLDAFIYNDGALKLCPLIEINPRKTMGLLALNLATHYKKKVQITLGPYHPKTSLLPHFLSVKDRVFYFHHHLNLTFL